MGKNLTLQTLFFISLLMLGLFQIKYKVVELEDEIKTLNREIFKAEESIHILKAEWAYRTSPQRLDKLVQNHLGLYLFQWNQFEIQEDQREFFKDKTSVFTTTLNQESGP